MNSIREFYGETTIDEKDSAHLREELGDVLLQVLLHSQIASEHNEFTLDDVAKELKDKLIHRHPHVFGNAKVNSADDVVVNWDKLKQEEKTDRKSQMDGISTFSASRIPDGRKAAGEKWLIPASKTAECTPNATPATAN